ncbi:MAG: hypothetical protein AB1721_01480 [Patescibacteria group bacterium]
MTKTLGQEPRVLVYSQTLTKPREREILRAVPKNLKRKEVRKVANKNKNQNTSTKSSGKGGHGKGKDGSGGGNKSNAGGIRSGTRGK